MPAASQRWPPPRSPLMPAARFGTVPGTGMVRRVSPASERTSALRSKPGKWARLLRAGADAVIEGADGMAELARALHRELPN